MKTTAVIMAGGKGERFWPKSRQSLPKQFLSLTNDGKTMIQLTAERHRAIIDYEDMFVVTNKDYVDLVKQQLPQIPEENILAEPMARNTAPCVGYAATVIGKKYDDAVMLVLASDHLIKNETLYLDSMIQAVELAKEEKKLVTIGITPTYPETGYGYIHFGRDEADENHRGIYIVKKFVEKPDLERANKYLDSGEYLWNSGMFVWKVSSIMACIKKFMPDTYKGLEKIGEAVGSDDYEKVLTENYTSFASESIDYGIMEKASDIYTIPGNFGWDDVGSWLALARINKINEDGNYIYGDVVTIDTSNSIISGGSKFIATIGINDVVVVDTDDALLICDKDETGKVKKVLETLKICNRTELM